MLASMRTVTAGSGTLIPPGRFLPHAKQLLAAADAAVLAIRPTSWPLRVEVWGHVQAPLRMVRRLIDQTPRLLIELSMRRSLPTALEALERGEIDACFGSVHDLGRPWPAGLAHRPVLLEHVAVAIDAEHPLADTPVLRPADLQGLVMWFPVSGSSPEVLGGFRRIADRLGTPLDTGGQNLGLDGIIGQLRSDLGRFALFGADWRVPADAGIRLVPLDPAPCYLSSLVWREGDQHPLLDLLLDRALQAGRTAGWLAYDCRHHWLPDTDLADLLSEDCTPGSASSTATRIDQVTQIESARRASSSCAISGISSCRRSCLAQSASCSRQFTWRRSAGRRSHTRQAAKCPRLHPDHSRRAQPGQCWVGDQEKRRRANRAPTTPQATTISRSSQANWRPLFVRGSTAACMATASGRSGSTCAASRSQEGNRFSGT
jgi:LysR substrate binding domain